MIKSPAPCSGEAYLLPISLTLKNFLSYRDAAPTLRLDHVHVACLCGSNGAGKSALLDAITWALWGRARGQRQDQLMHHAQEEMSVDLEFGVGQEQYRVTRRYSTARKTPQSSLELGVLTGDDYRPITGGTIAETQADIIRRTNMDYDTFVNSAFLVQGRADLFAMATATQRKEVLARVLGLGIYDRLEERAKLHNRESQGMLNATAFQLGRLQEQVAQAESVRATLGQVDEQLTGAQERAASVEQRLALLRAQVEQLERRSADALELEAASARVSRRRAGDMNEEQEVERRLFGWRQAEERAPEIQAGFAGLEEARERLRTLNAAAQSVMALQRELSPLDQQISSARAGLESEVQRLSHQLNEDLTPKAAGLGMAETRLAELDAVLVAIDTQSVEVTGAQEQEQALRVEVRRLETDNSRIAAEGKGAREKIALLTHDHVDGAACPLCGTELEPEGRERIEKTYEQEIADLLARHGAQVEEAKRLEARADDLAGKAKAARGHVDAERRRLDGEHARLVVQRDEATAAQVQMASATQALAQSKSRLLAGEYAIDEQTDAGNLRTRIAEQAADAHAATAAEQTVRELEHWDREYQSLAEAQTRRPEDEGALARVRARVAESDQELARVAEQRTVIEGQIAELRTYGAQQAAVEVEAAEAAKERDALQERRGSLAHQLAEITIAEVALQEQEANRKGLVEESSVYSELALAFGKGGVQALLIEAAIPRLEDEANALLTQMTEGRMSLRLQTQRQRRSGRGTDGSESVETLDIFISDEVGERNYDMFSGGERFRVDFALRIALSKLLAWRAGAPLPTLFIDEGFGTQDAEGRDRILDVIKAIEDRFERILVITHLDEVKEAFPVRIEVTRSNSGSTFSLS